MADELKAFKFQFDVLIEKIAINISFPCSTFVTWKRGTNKIETIARPAVDLSKREAVFNEKLTMFANLYIKDGSKVFAEKKTIFTVIIISQKGNKVAGQCSVDFADLINQQITEKFEELKLEKCPDRNAKLSMKINILFHGEVKDFDSMSNSIVSNRLNDSLDGIESLGKFDDEFFKKSLYNDNNSDCDKDKIRAKSFLITENEKGKYTSLDSGSRKKLQDNSRSYSVSSTNDQSFWLSLDKMQSETSYLKLEADRSKSFRLDESESGEPESGTTYKQLREHFEKELEFLNNKIRDLEQETKKLEIQKYKLVSDLELERRSKKKDISNNESLSYKISSLEMKINRLEREKKEEAEHLSSEKSMIERSFNKIKAELINEKQTWNQERLEFLELKHKYALLEQKLRNSQTELPSEGRNSLFGSLDFNSNRSEELELKLLQSELVKYNLEQTLSDTNKKLLLTEENYKKQVQDLECLLVKKEENFKSELNRRMGEIEGSLEEERKMKTAGDNEGSIGELLALRKSFSEKEKKYCDIIQEKDLDLHQMQIEKNLLDIKLRETGTRLEKIQEDNEKLQNSIGSLMKHRQNLEEKNQELKQKLQEMELKCLGLSKLNSTQIDETTIQQRNFHGEHEKSAGEIAQEGSAHQEYSNELLSVNPEEKYEEISVLQEKCLKLEQINTKLKTELSSAWMSFSRRNSDFLSAKEQINELEVRLKTPERGRFAINEKEIISIKELIGDVINIALENGDSDLVHLIHQIADLINQNFLKKIF